MRVPQQAPNAATGQALRGFYQSSRLSCFPTLHGRRCRSGLAARAVTTHAETRTAGGLTADACDLVLSSGFLAFAGHAGFLQAVEEAGLRVGGVMGTSAGALVGSLYCAGYSPRQVAKHLSEQTPASLLRPSVTPWRGGALSLDAVIERLKELLPARFEDLSREFAVGVVTADGRHLLIDSGPLPEAVAASAAIPFVFQAVDVPGHAALHGPFKDGGVVDRVGLKAWRERRRAQIKQQQQRHQGHGAALRPPPCLVHVIDRSSPFSGFDDTRAMGESQIVVVNSPRSGANFFDLGSFEAHMAAATERARPHLASVRWCRSQPQQSLSAAGHQHHSQQQQQQHRSPSVAAGSNGNGHASSPNSNGSSYASSANGNGYTSNGNGNGYPGKVAASHANNSSASNGNGNGNGYAGLNGASGVVNGNGLHGSGAVPAGAAASAAAATVSPSAPGSPSSTRPTRL